MTRGDTSQHNLIGGMTLKVLRNHREGFDGKLPHAAPLANPYVPFQLEDPPKYHPRMGLIRGTLFPGLDLPFMNMVNTKEKAITPKSELQAIGFGIQELALYLDTHPEDKEALELYKTYQQLYAKALELYESKCGPLNHHKVTKGDRYSWLDDPWPWEYAANKEG